MLAASAWLRASWSSGSRSAWNIWRGNIYISFSLYVGTFINITPLWTQDEMVIQTKQELRRAALCQIVAAACCFLWRCFLFFAQYFRKAPQLLGNPSTTREKHISRNLISISIFNTGMKSVTQNAPAVVNSADAWENLAGIAVNSQTRVTAVHKSQAPLMPIKKQPPV